MTNFMVHPPRSNLASQNSSQGRFVRGLPEWNNYATIFVPMGAGSHIDN